MKQAVLLLSSLLIFSQPTLAQDLAGKIVAIRGQVEVQAPPWAPAQLNQSLYEGNVIRTLSRSRVAILLTDETQLKLNENTEILLRTANRSSSLMTRISQAGSQAETIMNMNSGRVHVRSKKRPARVRVDTPAITAAIRGTEFDIRVEADGQTFATVLAGSIDFRNDFGAIMVNPGEQGQARIGQAPTKVIVLNPEDAVQWTLFYSASVSGRDYPFLYSSAQEAQRALDAGIDNPLLKAQVLHDAGRLNEALEALKEDRSPVGAEIRGWINLVQNRTGEAIEQFRSAASDSPRTRLGMSLAHLRAGEFSQAYQYVEDPGTEDSLRTQKAVLQLVSGEFESSAKELSAISPDSSSFALAQGLLSTAYLVQDKKEEASTAARLAVEANPGSPSAYLSRSLVEQSLFRLDDALQSVEQALQVDPLFLQAQVQHARLLFGIGYTARAERVIRESLAQAPEEADVNTMMGFILLARGKSEEAQVYFEKALAQDSTLADPHLGLGILSMRKNEPLEAAAEMLIASTLEPRLSLYQSYLAKAFFENREFEQAFTALDAAMELDPLDPTPHLYAGIFQDDLNRPGQSVHNYQDSIYLNDSRAVYRSRYLLDEDLATRNVNLAGAYRRLGFSEWGNSEAIKSNLSDPTNSSAHLFLASTFLNLKGRTGAAGSELLVARLGMPVNTNSFNTFNDYTTLFEQPRLNWTLAGEYGSFDSVDGTVVATGGSRRYAYGVVLGYDRTAGFLAQNDDSKDYVGEAVFKFALTPSSDFLFSYSHLQRKQGATGSFIVGSENDPDLRSFTRTQRAEVGYHHHLRPGSELMFYFSSRSINLVTDDGLAVASPSTVLQCWRFGYGVPPCGLTDRRNRLDNPSFTFQALHLLKLPHLQFKYGLDIFSGSTKNRFSLHYLPHVFAPFLFPDPEEPRVELDPLVDEKDIRTSTVFVQADYTVTPQLVLTGGLNYDWANDDNPSVGPGDFVDVDKDLKAIPGSDQSTSFWNPQGGLFYSPFESTDIRFVAMRSLQPLVSGVSGAAFVRERLVPTHLNGFLLNLNEPELSRTDSYNLGWDQRIGSSTFIRTTAFWRDRDIPTAVAEEAWTENGFVPLTVPSIFEGESYGGGIVWNQFVTRKLTVTAEYSVISDENPSYWRRDHEAIASLFFVSPTGFSFQVHENFLNQDARLGPDPFNVKVFTTDLGFAYELPEKIGLISFEARNVFDRRYQYLVDPFSLDPRIPKRQLVVGLRFYF